MSKNQNHFIIPYYGNKRKEMNIIYESIKDNLDDVKNIVEPFCGTCAFSYYLSLSHPKKFKYIINDNNNYLIELIRISKNENQFVDLVEKLKQLHILTDDKTKYLKICEKSKNDFISWVFVNVIYSLRPGLYPINKQIKKERFDKFLICDFLNFIRTEDIEIFSDDYINIYNKYKDDENSLIFLDPPYLSSCNAFYKIPDVNIYDYLNVNNIDNEKSKIILCLENNWIINLLFKNNKFIEYDKKYELSKKYTKHLLIKNKNIK